MTPGLTTTGHSDSDEPSPGDAYFYLVTVENRLAEEGTRGTQSDGTPRSDANACP